MSRTDLRLNFVDIVEMVSRKNVRPQTVVNFVAKPWSEARSRSSIIIDIRTRISDVCSNAPSVLLPVHWKLLTPLPIIKSSRSYEKIQNQNSRVWLPPWMTRSTILELYVYSVLCPITSLSR